MIEIPMRYKVKFAKTINYIFLDRIIMVKKKKTQIRNIKNEKIRYRTDVAVLKRWSPSAVYLKLSQHCELAVLQYKIQIQ